MLGKWGSDRYLSASVQKNPQKQKTQTNKHTVLSSQAGLSLWDGCAAYVLCGCGFVWLNLLRSPQSPRLYNGCGTAGQPPIKSRPPVFWTVTARLGQRFLTPLTGAPHRVARLFCTGPAREQCGLCGHTILCRNASSALLSSGRAATDNT